MLATFRRLIVLAGWLTVSVAYGQNNATPELNLTLGEQRVKFAPTRGFQEMRLEVVNSTGEIVFTHLTAAAEFDWNLRAGNGEPLAAGLYSYVLTLKLSEEQTSQHRGNLIVEQGNGQGQQQVWLTTQDGATVSGSSLNAVRNGGRSIAGFRTAEEKGHQRAIEGRELAAEKSGNLNNLTKAVRQEKAALLGTFNFLAKFAADGVSLIDSAVIETSGNVGIGMAFPNAKLSVSANTVAPPSAPGIIGYFANANESNTFITADSYGNSVVHSDFLFRRARGTMAAPLSVQTDDIIGQIQARGYGATGFATTARAGIRLTAAQNWTDTAQGAYLAFMTTPIGSNTINVERMRITDDGNVGIGTITPTHKLDVAGTINTTEQYNIDGNRIISGSGNNLFIGKDTNGLCFGGCFFATAIGVGAIAGISNSVTLGRAQDKVIIPGGLSVAGNASFDGDLSVNGNLNFIPSGSGGPHLCYSGGKITDCSISSVRYKKNITPLKAGLSEINRLRPVNFTWKKTDEKDFGLIAEEVAEAAPLLTVYDKDGTVKGVNYDKINVVLINAVKEQQAMIAQQQRMMARLQKRLLKLEKTRKLSRR